MRSSIGRTRLSHMAANESGKAIIEVGIYLLVLTPILRVAASMVLFLFEERDWL